MINTGRDWPILEGIRPISGKLDQILDTFRPCRVEFGCLAVLQIATHDPSEGQFGTLSPALMPPVLKLASNAWPLGPGVASCPVCGAIVRPDIAHICVCDAIRSVCRMAWPTAELPEDVEQRVLAFCGDGMAEERIESAAVAIEACWSVVVAGAAARSTAAGAFRARLHAMALRSAAVARVRGGYL